MSSSHQLDDLGEEGGRAEIPFAGKARQLVFSPRVVAVGNRPRDHAQRDLLIGGWQKDGRCYQFRKLIKHKDPRCYEDTSSLRKTDRDTCARARAFQIMHAAALYRIKHHLGEDSRFSRTLSSLLRCPPTLIGFDSESLKRQGFRTCNRARLCPYCLSRKVLNLYERLSNDYGVGTNKCLASVAITAPMSSEVASSSFSCGTRDLFKRAAKEVRVLLSNLAKKHLGLTGGLFVTDAGPNLVTNDRWSDGELVVEKSKGLELHSVVLGEVPMSRAVTIIQDRSANEHSVPSIQIGPTEIRPTLIIRLCTERDALRSLLFGEAPSEYRGDDVVDGVFRFPPWYVNGSRIVQRLAGE